MRRRSAQVGCAERASPSDPKVSIVPSDGKRIAAGGRFTEPCGSRRGTRSGQRTPSRSPSWVPIGRWDSVQHHDARMPGSSASRDVATSWWRRHRREQTSPPDRPAPPDVRPMDADLVRRPVWELPKRPAPGCRPAGACRSQRHGHRLGAGHGSEDRQGHVASGAAPSKHPVMLFRWPRVCRASSAPWQRSLHVEGKLQLLRRRRLGQLRFTLSWPQAAGHPTERQVTRQRAGMRR